LLSREETSSPGERETAGIGIERRRGKVYPADDLKNLAFLHPFQSFPIKALFGW
jgi:hypothetical protein